ncbi:hypothetical protein ACN47E_008754 [Coniothyrium glycines]
MRAMFSALPEELIIHIASMLMDNTSALSGLAKCSRDFARIFKPLLYRTINVRCTDPQERAIPLLLRTLIDRPQYGEYVQDLSVEANVDIIKSNGDRVPNLFPASDTLFKVDDLVSRSIAGLPHHQPPHQGWHVKLTQRAPVAFTGLLLTRLPNLVHLTLIVSECEGYGGAVNVLSRLFGLLTRPSSPHISAFTPCLNLDHVKNLRTTGYNLDILAVEFPQLRELAVNLVIRFEDHAGNLRYSSGTARPSEIIHAQHQLKVLKITTDWEDLELHPSTKHTATLLRFLRCYNITEIHFTLARGPRRPVLPGTLLSWNALTAILYPVRNTLEVLKLSITEDTKAFPQACYPRFYPIHSLKHFHRLRVLELPQTALLHRHYRRPTYQKPHAELVYPPSLKEVLVTWPDQKSLDWLFDITATTAKGTHRIEKVTFSCVRGFGKPASWFFLKKREIEAARNARMNVEILGESAGKTSSADLVDLEKHLGFIKNMYTSIDD